MGGGVGDVGRPADAGERMPELVSGEVGGDSFAERLSLQGNPALRDDWFAEPDGSAVDFLTFARTEGRFGPHFDPSGTPSPEMEATNADRLANWRGLQEMAGIGR